MHHNLLPDSVAPRQYLITARVVTLIAALPLLCAPYYLLFSSIPPMMPRVFRTHNGLATCNLFDSLYVCRAYRENWEFPVIWFSTLFGVRFGCWNFLKGRKKKKVENFTFPRAWKVYNRISKRSRRRKKRKKREVLALEITNILLWLGAAAAAAATTLTNPASENFMFFIL